MSSLRNYLEFQKEDEMGAALRKSEYANVVETYYTFSTTFFQLMWGKSFHFAPRRRGESFRASLTRYEHWLAARMGLRPGMRVLDLGCGVGGPMRTIARYSDASIVGVTISPQQVTQGSRLNRRGGMSSRCDIVLGDFMRPPFADGDFDAAYDVEALVHAPDVPAVFSQVYRVLRPGAVLGGYTWCMTDRYRPDDIEHRRVKRTIERGTALVDILTMHAWDDALRGAGFEILDTEDRMVRSDPETPWYRPLTGREADPRYLLFTRPGRFLLDRLTVLGERGRLLPSGTRDIQDLVMAAVDALVDGGKLGILTPSYFYLCRKPLE